MESKGYAPLIDMSKDDTTVSNELFNALTTVGFACLTNTGLWELAEGYAKKSMPFFDLPHEEKNKYAKPAGAYDFCGWHSRDREQLNKNRPADYKEAFNFHRNIKGNRDRVPEMLDNEELWNLADKFESEAKRVLYLIGLGLKLEDPYKLVKSHSFTKDKNNSNFTRVVWYPKIDPEIMKPGQVRCGEHSDYGSVSLLYTSAPGLQVMNRELGEYVDAGFIEGGIFVNVGDLLQMWSGDTIIASKHRVLLPEKEYMDQDRMSVVYFCQPEDHAPIETLDGSGKYPPTTSKQWLTEMQEAGYL